MPATLEHVEQYIESTSGTAPPGKPPEKPPGSARLMSLDAFRGFIMIVLAANGFGWRHLREHPGFAWIANQFEHVPWEGMVFWDLIQPAFMFMVGVAMPFAVARRMEDGANSRQVLGHVAWRSLMLILLSQMLICISGNRLQFQLINVLSQIAFTYLIGYLILQLRFRAQVAAALGLLAGHTLLFVLFPGPEGPWSKAGNIGGAIDSALGLKYSGYYVTINFLSSAVTTLFGVWTGLLMQRAATHTERMRVLAGAALAGFAGGWALSAMVPMVKRIWTSSFTLFSTGWVLVMLLAFYWMVEVRGWRKPVFPLVVVGMNSIFIYSISMVLSGWIDRSVAVFTGRFLFVGDLAPVAQATAVVLVMWYLCYWLYQRKIFFKI